MAQELDTVLWGLLREHGSLGNGKASVFCQHDRLKTFDRVVTMWNPDWFTEADYANDELDRFPNGAGFPCKASAVIVGACPRLKSSRGPAFRSKSAPGLPGLRAFHSNPSREMQDPYFTEVLAA